MATQVKHRRGTQSEIDNFTPAIGEIVVNTTDTELVVGDGVTLGGVPVPKKTNTLLSFNVIEDVISNKSIKNGYSVILSNGGVWDVVLASTVTPNQTFIRECTGVPSLALVYRVVNDCVNIDHFRNDSLTDDVNILSGVGLAKNSGYGRITCTGEWTIPIPQRSQGGYSSYMTWNYSILVDGYNGEVDFSAATFSLETNSISDARMTLFVFLNSSAKFHAPKVDGKLSQQFMGSSYIDDCVVRIGGGCRDFSLILDKDIVDFGGHGVVVRNYIQDGFADIASGVPVNISITGKGHMKGMWQSGIVPITGNDIVVSDYKVTHSGNNNTFNSQQATTGHNFHQEAVSDGTQDPHIKDVAFVNCTAESARQHGFMIHTAINNTRIAGGWSRLNGENGARYEGFCQVLDVDGLVIEDNDGDGEFISLSTASWLGSETKDVVATIRSTVLRSGGVGKRDNSGGVSIQVSGFSSYNQSHGVIMATAATNIRQLLRDLVVSNNCANGSEGYGIYAESSSIDNVRVVNQDASKFNQIPVNFNGEGPIISNLVIDGDLPTGYEFVTGLAIDLPVGGVGMQLYGEYATIFNDRILFAPFPNGVYTLPKGYKYYKIDRLSGAYPNIRIESNTDKIVGREFEIDYVGSVNGIDVRTRDQAGTINGAAQPFLMQANTKYKVVYETSSNVLITAV